MQYARIIFTFTLFLLPLFAHAQNTLYTTPLTRIPGITDEATLSGISTYGLAGFLNGIITFTFTAAAIASVIMIVMIGFQYVTTEKSGPNVSALRQKITSVAFGIALIASMYIIFKFINPDIIDSLNIFSSASNLPAEKKEDYQSPTPLVTPVIINPSPTPAITPTTPNPSPISTAKPTLNFTSSSLTVTSGNSATLSWSTINITSCTASGGWTGSKGPSGSVPTGPLTSNKYFGLSCTGPGGQISHTVNITVAPQTTPSPYTPPTFTFGFSASEYKISSGGYVTLAWNSPSATSCIASNSPGLYGWAGNKLTSGSERVGPITSNISFSMTCTGPGGQKIHSLSIIVESSTTPTPSPTPTPPPTTSGTPPFPWTIQGKLYYSLSAVQADYPSSCVNINGVSVASGFGPCVGGTSGQ